MENLPLFDTLYGVYDAKLYPESETKKMLETYLDKITRPQCTFQSNKNIDNSVSMSTINKFSEKCHRFRKMNGSFCVFFNFPGIHNLSFFN